MGLSRRDVQLICCVFSFVSKLVSFVVGPFLQRESISDVVDVTVGAGLTSISLVHILPRAEDYIAGPYPFAALVALGVFTLLTLFTFIRDSLALMDDTMLTTCDTINMHTTATTDLLDGQQVVERQEFMFGENAPTLFLCLSSAVTSVASGILLSSAKIETLQSQAPTHIAIQFLEFIAIARYVAMMPIRKWLYVVLGVVLSAIEPALMMAPIENVNWKTVVQFSGYASSVLLGVYLFLGSIAVQGGLAGVKHNVRTGICMVLAFAVPTAIPTSLRMHQ